MDVILRSLAANSAGKEIKLPKARFLIGRDEDCHLRPKSDLVSRHHCMVLVDADGVAVRDLGSRNGTYVNDQRIVGEQLLVAGDRLRVGPLEFEVRILATAPSAVCPVETSPAVGQEPLAEPSVATQPAAHIAAADRVAVAAVSPPVVATAFAAPTAADDLEAFYLQALGAIDTRATQPASSPSKPTAATPHVPAHSPSRNDILAEETETITSSASGTQILRPTKGKDQHASSIPSTTHGDRNEESATDEQASAEVSKIPPPKGIAGKLPFPRTMTKDSRSAAADTLRRFFNRRYLESRVRHTVRQRC